MSSSAPLTQSAPTLAFGRRSSARFDERPARATSPIHRLCVARISASTLFACIVAAPSAAQCAGWDARFFGRGTNDDVRALAVLDDGIQSVLYVGGEFSAVADVPATRVARWDGTGWSAVGGGIDGTVYALAAFDDGSVPELYAGGTFLSVEASNTSASNVARWSGSSWQPLGEGLNAQVSALTVFDDGTGPALYAGGAFSASGATSMNRIAKWDGTSWSALGSGMSGGAVKALCVYDDGAGSALYAGGNYFVAGGISALRIAKWDGSSWSALGAGMQGGGATEVLGLAVFDAGSGSELCAVGTFATAGGVSASNVAKWNGTSWSALGSGLDDQAWCLATVDHGAGAALYAGGDFGSAGGGGAARIAKWDGTSWSALDAGLPAGAARVMAGYDGVAGTELIVGGVIAIAGDIAARNVARWSGTTWSSLDGGMGLHTDVRALTVFDDGEGAALYAGGIFTAAGAVAANRIARWNGSSWSALGTGLTGGSSMAVEDLTVFDDGSGPALYAAGNFASAGGTSANNVAKWDGASWSALASGIGTSASVVRALAVFDDGTGAKLFAGGLFTTAGGVGADNVARWDGASWSAVGSGTGGSDPTVRALIVFDDGSGPALYAGGTFTTAGGSAVFRIAKWDGTTWSSLRGGVPGTDPVLSVRALAVYDDGVGPALFVGGRFNAVSGVPANNIVRWSGTSWSALGAGTGGAFPTVESLTTFDEGFGRALFVGGSFNLAGGANARCIARWNGAAWSTLRAGFFGSAAVVALGGFDDGADGAPDLYAGGSFTTVGATRSEGIAQWHGCPPGEPYCFGDGLDPVQTVECPCGNVGDPGHGCLAFPSSLGGARLFASGSVNPNTVVLKCEDVVNNTLCTFVRSPNNNPVGLVFGDGVRCVNPPLLRFGQQNSGQGGNAPFTASVPAPSEIPGSTFHYFVWYRNPVGGWCTSELFNASNGYTIAW